MSCDEYQHFRADVKTRPFNLDNHRRNPLRLTMFFRLLPLTLLAVTSVAVAEIYKCVSPKGEISFSNNPFCEHKQAYAKDRFEPLLMVKPQEIAKFPAKKIIEILTPRTELPDLLEHIGRVAGIPVEPVALEGNAVTIKQVSHHWLELFNRVAAKYELDYRQAYGRLYVYKIGSMGETIVHSPDLLRWYQSDTTWDVVIKNDDILLNMKAYEQTNLRERLPRLVKLVRDDLGEQDVVNAAQTVVLKENLSRGVSSGIVAKGDAAADAARAAAEKAKRITARRQSN